jgi:hypothetical protein
LSRTPRVGSVSDQINNAMKNLLLAQKTHEIVAKPAAVPGAPRSNLPENAATNGI